MKLLIGEDILFHQVFFLAWSWAFPSLWCLYDERWPDKNIRATVNYKFDICYAYVTLRIFPPLRKLVLLMMPLPYQFEWHELKKFSHMNTAVAQASTQWRPDSSFLISQKAMPYKVAHPK
jgi:hypothetical protein